MKKSAGNFSMKSAATLEYQSGNFFLPKEGINFFQNLKEKIGVEPSDTKTPADFKLVS